MRFDPEDLRGSRFSASAAERADREGFVLKNDAVLRTLVRWKYFSWDVEGAELLPRQGPVVYAMNHAGWFALDAIIMGCSVAEAIGVSRVPYFAVHEAALGAPVVGPYLRRMGGLPTSLFRDPRRLPAGCECYGFCPEGVSGNTKPFWEAYRMREWNRGFVRLALALKAQIVPVAVLGGEECLPVAWTIKALEPVVGSILGWPLAPVPLPARWKVVFHPPVCVTGCEDPARPHAEHCRAIARQLQAVVQGTLDREVAHRPLARLSALVAAATSRARPDAYRLDAGLPASAAATSRGDAGAASSHPPEKPARSSPART